MLKSVWKGSIQMSFGTKPISLFKAICLALVVVCFFTLLMPWLSGTRDYMTGMRSSVGVFSTGLRGRAVSFWSVMLIFNAILLFLAVGLAVFGLITEKGGLSLPLALVGLLLFFLALFQCLLINGRTGMRFHVGIGPWLLLLLSLGIPGLVLLDNAAAKKPLLSMADFGLRGGAPKADKGSWTCPTCGVKHSTSLKFCDRCGTPRPEPPRCPACGSLIHPGEAFCANCGAKI